MTVAAAFRSGLGRVWRAPGVIAGLWLATLLVAWPLAVVLHGMIADHLGASLAADAAASGVHFDWWNEFLAQTSGVGQTFVPAILGFAAVVKNLSSIADAQAVAPPIALAIAAHLLMSTFLMGGVLDRLARDRRVTSVGFFGASGRFFFRLLRLGLMAAALYAALFAWLHDALFTTAFEWITYDLTVERTAIVYRAVMYGVFGTALAMVNLVIDYARIRIVVEDRRSAVGAVAAAARFVWRNAAAVLGVYGLTALVFGLVLALYALMAPGAAGGLAVWIGFFIAQLYITLRIGVRLLFAASQIALFQGRLAHAGYTAAPVVRWPDSPAAEAISPP